MILPESFSRKWIMNHREKNKNSRINPPVLEKTIHALALTEALQKSGLNFVFKGGTALILLMEGMGRFSVDIDIIASHSQNEIEKALHWIKNNTHFTAWELDSVRSYKSGVPKAHYFMYFDSQLNKGVNYILLDILFEKDDYPRLIDAPVKSLWIMTDKNITTVKIPSSESITGDKFTAFAPNTTGILYNKGKELEIVKQVYDLGHLFDLIADIKEVNKSFQNIVAKEIAYRSLKIKPENVLDDTIETARMIAMRDRNVKEPMRSRFLEVQGGLNQFKGYLVSGNFRIDEAIESAAKAAYIAAKIKMNDFSSPEKFNGQKVIEDIINTDYNSLNRLKRMTNGSYFYWAKTLKTLKKL